ncbi:MAG: P1 family peptidase [Hyphomicrobiales bacterium]
MSFVPCTGKNNLITDVAGISVGNAGDEKRASGVTAILTGQGAVAGVDVRGGGPATRETDALDPSCLVGKIHGVVLSGGSVFGLAAADGAVQALAGQGIGFTFGGQPHPCPVVPAACLFDLTNGADKAWGNTPPYRELGAAACKAASADFALGNQGAGLGAAAGCLKGGLGSASSVSDGVTIGALAAVNSFGSAVVPGTDCLWAAPFAVGNEYPGGGLPGLDGNLDQTKGTKAELSAGADAPGRNTTLCVVATDADLTKAQAERLAIMAGDGMARALRPVHTPFDGDIVFALATGATNRRPDPLELAKLGGLAADCLARAIARGVWEAGSIFGIPALNPAN